MGRPTSRHRPALGENIVQARQAAGLTQRQVASALGVSQRVMTYWERDAASIPATQLTKLAELLGVTTDKLLGHKQSPDRKAKQALDLIGGLPAQQQRAILKSLKASVDKAARGRR